jgi:hypothetical protein
MEMGEWDNGFVFWRRFWGEIGIRGMIAGHCPKCKGYFWNILGVPDPFSLRQKLSTTNLFVKYGPKYSAGRTLGIVKAAEFARLSDPRNLGSSP